MKSVLCLAGRHDWQKHINHDMGGPNARYETCRRCGKEKKSYGPPSQYSRVLPG